MTSVLALAFDVGGTVFDWKGAVIGELQVLARQRGVALDAEAFALDWRKRMFELLGEVRGGGRPWMNADALHRHALDDLAPVYPALALSPAELDELNWVWHRMRVWPDFPDALEKLRQRYRVVVLTVLSFAIALDSSRHNGIRWDGILSCEFLGHYKPDAEAYLSGCRLLGLAPEQVMMVASHPLDLLAASRAGLRTAFVQPKLSEPDLSGFSADVDPEGFDVVGDDFTALADELCK